MSWITPFSLAIGSVVSQLRDAPQRVPPCKLDVGNDGGFVHVTVQAYIQQPRTPPPHMRVGEGKSVEGQFVAVDGSLEGGHPEIPRSAEEVDDHDGKLNFAGLAVPAKSCLQHTPDVSGRCEHDNTTQPTKKGCFHLFDLVPLHHARPRTGDDIFMDGSVNQ
ncbi:unnamed protein product, partial [Aphanomyces euteiches]